MNVSGNVPVMYPGSVNTVSESNIRVMGSRNLHNNAFNTVPKLDAKIGDGISSLEANIYNYTRLK